MGLTTTRYVLLCGYMCACAHVRVSVNDRSARACAGACMCACTCARMMCCAFMHAYACARVCICDHCTNTPPSRLLEASSYRDDDSSLVKVVSTVTLGRAETQTPMFVDTLTHTHTRARAGRAQEERCPCKEEDEDDDEGEEGSG